MIAGDIICIFGGTTTPQVLREVDVNFMLIGDCVIDDLMVGEAVVAM
jgi:hypothetical protein